jgi:hypothetical protein
MKDTNENYDTIDCDNITHWNNANELMRATQYGTLPFDLWCKHEAERIGGCSVVYKTINGERLAAIRKGNK